MKSVHCKFFLYGGKCMHQAAPRRMFGAAKCIVWGSSNAIDRSVDPRIAGPVRCKWLSTDGMSIVPQSESVVQR